ncbi:exodeoxyribonuclease III [Candidatus Cytomitobacter primus]|uniref:Exodeoxyribonuclease III n=1 Tax=Candidatus Cytomitobacter primus TaxID=2066024 RepID=A0A5C0UE32_9PROT|nr:exodeoxyribonuclease III [Candidatus Cytomitobacter primus]QEK38345.1 exodeoxyribonuclease III [Candidatus Cytomitobacter primus]
MKIVTWNVNSVRVRLPLLEELIKTENPDVILLQETKCMNDVFPREFFESYNYHLAIHGQKTYNGVAIISKYPIENIKCNLDDESVEARYIEGFTNGKYVASIYVPCGNKSPEAYEYKQKFLSQVASRWDSDDEIVLGGDFNVAMSDKDIQTPEKWVGSVLCTPEVRSEMQKVFDKSFFDVHVDQFGKNDFTWWDYRRPNEGLRIDYILVKNIAGKLETLRKYRQMERPSDHVPVMITLT